MKFILQKLKNLVAPAVLAVFVLLSTMPGVKADELQRLSAEEIENLLTDNTAIGKWDGVGYRQYFGKDGVTLYAQDGSRTARGRWRVDRSKHLYESWWEQTDWTGYPVARNGEQFYWLSNSLPPQEFEIVSGQQLTPAD